MTLSAYFMHFRPGTTELFLHFNDHVLHFGWTIAPGVWSNGRRWQVYRNKPEELVG